MTTKLLFSIALGLAALGTVAYVATKPATEPAPEAAESAPAATSLTALLALENPVACTFTDDTEVAKTSGTVYIANGRARGDFIATAGGATYHAHTLIEGDVMHSWVDETKVGVNSALTANEAGKGIDAAKDLDYACGPWTPDESVFVLPADISFMGSAGAAAPANMCAQCEQVPEAYRAQCRVAAGC